MDQTADHSKHMIVVIGTNLADMPQTLRSDPRLLFLGSKESWKMRDCPEVRVVIRPTGISRSIVQRIDADVKTLRKVRPSIQTIALSNMEKFQEVVMAELQKLDAPIVEKPVASPLAAEPEPAPAVLETPASVPTVKPSRSRSQIVRDVFEDTLGDLTETWKKVSAEYPDVKRNTVGALIFQARGWFQKRNPALLERVELAKAKRNGNGHVPNAMVHVPATENVPAISANDEQASPTLQLSKSLWVFCGAFEELLKMLPPLIRQVEGHERNLAQVEKSAAIVFRAAQEMKTAVSNLN